jgi:hypothetical protein
MPIDGTDSTKVERRLVAILAADITGNSGLLGVPSAALSADDAVHCTAASVASGWEK